MTWRQIPQSALAVDWSSVFRRSRVDPYLVWADATNFKGLSKVRPHFLQIAFESKAGVLQTLERGLDVPILRVTDSIYVANVRLDDRTFRVLYPPDESVPAFRFVMGMPSAGTLSSFLTPPSLCTSPAMAVIDDGCAFAHAHFREQVGAAWRSRIEELWDQNPGANKAGTQGRVYSRTDLEAALNASAIPNGIDEDACYRLLSKDFTPDYAADYVVQLLKPASHGTHVLDVAAGRPNPLASIGLGAEIDAAASADIFFVQLPKSIVRDTSGGSLDVYVLQALAYLRAKCLKRNVIVNLSYGSYGGPHDGETVFERAMDSFVSDTAYPASSMVLPAGNAYDARIHAAVTLLPQQSETISVHVQSDSLTDTFVEFWYPDNVPGSSKAVEFDVSPPVQGASTGPCPLNTARVWFRPTPANPSPTEPVAGLFHLESPSSGAAKSMACLAIAPTGLPRLPRPTAPHGVWTIKVSNKATSGDAIRVRAWVERDDASFGSGRSQSQATFVSQGAGAAPGEPHAAVAPIVRESNLNSIGHGAKTTVIGGYILKQKRMAKYSASGRAIVPDLRQGPNLVAACEESEVLRGLLAAGNRTNLPFRMNGTSVAAPMVARALLNLSGTGLPLDAIPLPPQILPPAHPPVDPTLREGAGSLK